MRRFCLLTLLLLATTSLTTAQVKYATPTCPGMHVRMLPAISNNGIVVGAYYTDTDPLLHPLLISKGNCIAVGQNTALAEKFSYPTGVNNRGDIAGVYFDGGPFTPPVHGFLLEKNGVLTILDFPGADNTQAQKVNESGTVVGWWSVNDSSGNLLFTHGFVWKNGAFVNDVTYETYPSTLLTGINARGDSVGAGEASGIGHGFLYSKGQFTRIDVPSPAVGEAPQGINDKGDVVGQFFDEGFTTLHGFLKTGNAFTTIDFPGAMWTNVSDINNSGQMVGAYWDSSWNLHGFYAKLE